MDQPIKLQSAEVGHFVSPRCVALADERVEPVQEAFFVALDALEVALHDGLERELAAAGDGDP